MNTILIPCFNEEKTVGNVILNCINFFGKNSQIIVIDNASTDMSKSIINFHCSIYPHVEYHYCAEKGKSSAIMSVVNFIKFDTVVLQDADLEYDFKDVAKLLEIHRITSSDMTIGVRSSEFMLKRSILANSIIKCLLKIRFGKSLEDVLTGARIVRRDLLLKCKAKQFGLETELSRIVLDKNYKVHTGKCNYHPRVENKKIKASHIFELVKVALS